ncbi:MAG: sigma-54-dependent Fis family transcriptional regulator [Bacteroidales bacterium]|nr:sigma-54-dependent Fis family transcriptional regulator [Bacteroidales bacterium]MBQ1655093.1 sigma-54-dependent Fis family transcriptional regulator [Bacteroidales bacterium]MBQ1696026.1 sigma-54-dependent Fis family transcriptional regulator [Bacteroidales bacterium]MBQ2542491.1 sigma-54-dependent Fis family transcriptional regulator [Bacteroidales bacterium]MBQ2574872.1 sigma-54-dependent Fis family transcriptional regulator [Bacteroidales bacterium]
MAKILVIDDERSIRNTLSDILSLEGHKVDVAEDGEQGFKKASESKFDAVFCDIKMPKMDGLEVLAKLHDSFPELPIVMISGHGDIDTAVDSIKKGAFDYIQKPLDLNRLLVTLRNALDRSTLVAETKTLKKKVNTKYKMIGETPAMLKVKEMIERVAPTDARVLITGSNGTGKEAVAHWIHEKSNRASAPFVEVNCAAIPSELIESELFGHVKGSFTGAVKDKAGKFEQADGGTLFLDEIGDMSLAAQAKVLRALQENRITRIGSDKDVTVNVRVVAATNKNLREEIEKNNFREDLYHRLSVILIHVPTLNERIDDIPLLVDDFIKTCCEEQNFPVKKITDGAIAELKKINWRGNIRELRNVIERLVILCGNEITADDVKNYANVF